MTEQLHVEAQWNEPGTTVNFAELGSVCAMSRAELDELVEYGALSPINTSLEGDLFRVDCISPLRTAGKLRRDFDLDLFVVVILMDYLNRIETLEVQVRSLQARNH